MLKPRRRKTPIASSLKPADIVVISITVGQSGNVYGLTDNGKVVVWNPKGAGFWTLYTY